MKASTLLFDIKRGFDNIPPHLLIQKLKTHNVPSYLVD
jgi:hypothetical protein